MAEVACTSPITPC